MKTRLFGILTLVALVCLIAGLAGCKPKETGVTEANSPAPDPTKTAVEPGKSPVKPVTPTTTTPPEPAADGVLVTVNGVDITQEQLDALIKPHLAAIAKQAASLPPEFLEQNKKRLRDQALQEMIRMQLLNEKVEAAGITVSEQEIADDIARVAAAQKPTITVEQFKQKMVEYGYDIEQMKIQIRTVLGHNKLMAKEFPDEAKFTEEDAKAYYDKNKAKYETPEQIRASHILLKVTPSDPNSDPNEAKAAAMAKAEDLLKQIKEGADFAALAKTHSEGPSKPAGGDLNFFGRGRMVPAFDKAAFELKEIGDVSDIVETQFGLHIIKLTDKKEASTTTFEDVKDEIMAQQSQRKVRDLAMKYVETLRPDAKIEYAPGMEPKPAAPPSMPPGAVVPK